MIGDYGSRWVLLEWTPGFDGNSEILSLRVHVARQSSEESNILNSPVTTPT